MGTRVNTHIDVHHDPRVRGTIINVFRDTTITKREVLNAAGEWVEVEEGGAFPMGTVRATVADEVLQR